MSVKYLLRSITYMTAGLMVIFAPAAAQERLQVAQIQTVTPTQTEDTLLRLPKNNSLEVEEEISTVGTGQKLVPGGGLLLSFDTNDDGIIAQDEVEAGIIAAFAKADANSSGSLTPIEQIKWAESLEPYDASLANPVRFDPNLNRSVSRNEFTVVVRSLASNLVDEETGLLEVSRLIVPQ